MNDEEIWKPIPGYEGRYDISTHGRIRTLTRPRVLGGFRKLRLNKKGYLQVNLYLGGYRYFEVHRLVLLAFVGEPPQDHEVAHLDGKKSNNRLNNLAYVTHSENMSHRITHKTMPFGRRSGTAKLTEEQVRIIRQDCRPYDPINSISAMARKYGVSHRTIRFVLDGQTWRHVT